MDSKKTGAFIAMLRKEKKLTQMELAQLLHVSDKTISKWETGRGMPDTALLKPLSEALGVSIGELLTGARMEGLQDTVFSAPYSGVKIRSPSLR